MRFDKQGWATSGVTKKPTNSFYDRTNTQHIIVMHYTAGYTADSAVRTFESQKKPRSSAHFVIGTDGEIIQMVATKAVAFHAGGGSYRGKRPVNNLSIGIEIVNPGYHFSDGDGGYLNWARKPVRAERLEPFPGMTEAYDDWVGRKAFWPDYPLAQLDAVEDLCRGLIAQYGSIIDIVGHKDVDGIRRIKVDPGPAFPMLRFRKLLSEREENEDEPVYLAEVAHADTLNVRGGPGTRYEKLDWGPLRKGQEVQVIGCQGDWDNIRRWIDGTKHDGWSHSRYLEPK